MSVGQLGKLRPIDNRPTTLFALQQAAAVTNRRAGLVVTIARRIRPLTVVSTEAASLPHIAPVFATFMSHTPVRTLPCGRGSVPASLELFTKLD